MITSKQVTAGVNDNFVTLCFYPDQDQITIMINGCTCNFPASKGTPNRNDAEFALRALKEAAANL